MLNRALQHYLDVLSDFKVELEGDVKGNPILIEDLGTNASQIIYAMELVKSASHKVYVDYKDILCCALVTYVSYLEGLKKDVSDRLSGAKPRLERMENEIYLAKQTKGEIGCTAQVSQ
jgi:hypothetical protein